MTVLDGHASLAIVSMTALLGFMWAHVGAASTMPGAVAAPGPQPSTALSAVIPDASAWHPCDDVPSVECGDLEVPLVDLEVSAQEAETGSDMLRLPVRRLPARDQARRIGTLVLIAGGPGQRGTDLVQPDTHSEAILERFDIVGWDARGTGGETAIDCIPQWDPFVGLDRTPDTADERRALDERAMALAARCRQRHGALLPYVGTLYAALDLERLRRMLGESSISLLGLSYGSQVALTYATLFPDQVRSIVLDGYSDPDQAAGEREIEQAAAFEAQLDRLLARCAADAACQFHAGGTPHEALDRLFAGLDADALPAGDGRRLTQSDAYEAVVGALLRGDDAGDELLVALAAAEAGDGAPLLDIATKVRRSYEVSGLSQGAFSAIYCADTIGDWRALSPTAVAELGRRVDEVAPRLGDWLWSLPGSPDLPPVGLCAMHPTTPRTATGPIDAAGAGPVLVLAATGDPTTPLAGARRAVGELEDAVLVTLEADHHLTYPWAVAHSGSSGYRCLLDIVEAYLIDLDVPQAGRHCGTAAAGTGRGGA